MKCNKVTGFILGLMFIQPCLANPQLHLDGFLSACAGVMDVDPVFYQAVNVAATTVRSGSGLSPVYYAPVPTRPEIFNYNSKPEFQQGSIVALQGTLDFNNQYSMTVQVSSMGANEWEPIAEWAFVSYRFNDHWRLRGGRMRLARFMLSENLEVGYTYPWVRPPLEVYQMIPSNNFSGADITYRNVLWNQDLELGLQYGSIADPYNNPLGAAFNQSGEIFRHRQILSGVMIYGNEQFKFRAGYNEVSLSILPAGSVSQLATSYAAFYNANAIADADITNVKSFFANVGVTVDYKNWVVLSEWSKRGTNSVGIPVLKGYYATLGYRFGDFLPHFTYSNLKTTDKSRRIYSGTFGADMNPILALFNQDQATYILGLRYDIMTGVDIKIQAEDIRPLHGTAGLFNVNPHQRAQLYSAVIDLVF